MSQPCHGPSGGSGPGQDTVRSQLAGQLAADEERLRTMVATCDLDPRTVNQENVRSALKVIMRIYKTLRTDTQTEDGALARTGGTRVWESLKKQYDEAFDETDLLLRILVQFDVLDRGKDRAPTTVPQLYTDAGTMITCRRQWLTKVSEFQRLVTEFYHELVRAEQNAG
jgi:hypothetical protein